jgi:hypothetical protein
LRSSKSYLNHGKIGCAGSLNMTESPFVNDILTNQIFHGQKKLNIFSLLFGHPVFNSVPNRGSLKLQIYQGPAFTTDERSPHNHIFIRHRNRPVRWSSALLAKREPCMESFRKRHAEHSLRNNTVNRHWQCSNGEARSISLLDHNSSRCNQLWMSTSSHSCINFGKRPRSRSATHKSRLRNRKRSFEIERRQTPN